MSGKKGGLGRGLGALIPQGTTAYKEENRTKVNVNEEVDGVQNEISSTLATLVEIPINSISPNPRQPRQIFDEEALIELTHSIKEVGLLQPPVVRQIGVNRYELIMGERRWRACQAAGMATMPVIIKQTGDDALLRDALLENLHRSQLNPLEEGAAYDQLLKDFGCTHEELATRIGRSRPQISNTIRLLKLPTSVQRKVAAGVLSAGHARAILGLTDLDAMEQLANRIISEGLSVRATEEIVTLGGEGKKARKKNAKPISPRLNEISERLSDRYETRVRVELGKRKGKMTIEFASIEDLERILSLLER
ncbi:MAG TPA: ParB/RepB/Spo0J family partition protein [Candidatus Nanopelagicaceae bacterium]|nr:ParB/RepB/Spo0J family partition protein [Candidatus Nanopelagicaceae bacterium]